MIQIVRIGQVRGGVTLELRGQVAGAGVGILEEECRKLVLARKAVELDLSNVTFVSAQGLDALRGLLGEGVTVTGSPLIEGMLEDREGGRG